MLTLQLRPKERLCPTEESEGNSKWEDIIEPCLVSMVVNKTL